MRLLKTNELSGHEGSLRFLAIASRGNVLVSTADDFSIRVWQTNSWDCSSVLRTMDEGTHQAILVADLSPSGTYFATGVADFRTKVYSLPEGQLVLSSKLSAKCFPAESISFSPNEDWLACQRGRVVDCYRVGDFSKLAALEGHTSKVHKMCSTPDGRFLFTCGGKYVKVWDMRSFAEVVTIDAHKRTLGSIAVSQTNEHFITGGEDKQVFVWRIGDWVQRGRYTRHKDFVFDIAIAPDGLTAASWDMTRTLHCWDIKSQMNYGTLPGLWGRCEFVDSRHVLFASDKATLLIDATTCSVVQEMPPATAFAVARSGDWIALGESGLISIWTVEQT